MPSTELSSTPACMRRSTGMSGGALPSFPLWGSIQGDAGQNCHCGRHASAPGTGLLETQGKPQRLSFSQRPEVGRGLRAGQILLLCRVHRGGFSRRDAEEKKQETAESFALRRSSRIDRLSFDPARRPDPFGAVAARQSMSLRSIHHSKFTIQNSAAQPPLHPCTILQQR